MSQDALDRASYPTTSPEELAELAAHEDYAVRQGVARNPSTPPEVLAGLATDDYEYLRLGVAANPNTPPAVLEELLLGDGEMDVVGEAMRNPSTPATHRRWLFFALLVESPEVWEELTWSPAMKGIAEEEWHLAQTLASTHAYGMDSPLDSRGMDLQETVAAILSPDPNSAAPSLVSKPRSSVS